LQRSVEEFYERPVHDIVVALPRSSSSRATYLNGMRGWRWWAPSDGRIRIERVRGWRRADVVVVQTPPAVCQAALIARTSMRRRSRRASGASRRRHGS